MRICKGIVVSLCIVLCFSPFISFAAGGVTLVGVSGGSDIPANTAGVGGSGAFTNLTGLSITEGSIGNIKSGTITLTAPIGFEFDTANPATVTVTSNTSNPSTNINHLPSGTIAPTVTTVGAIYFTITSQSTSARNTLTWNSVRIRPTAITSIGSSDILLSSTGNIVGLNLPVSIGVVSELYIPPTLSSIAINAPASKLIYNVGDSLDINGLVVYGTYSDGSTKKEIITDADITGFDSSVAVSGQILTVTLGDKTVKYTVDIVPPSTPPESLGTKIENVTINADTTWNKSGSPYIIGPDVVIVAGKLTVEHGVSIVFNSRITVEGGIVLINGTKNDPVHMTGPEGITVPDGAGFIIKLNGELHASWLSCAMMNVCISEWQGGKTYINHGVFENVNSGIAAEQYGVLDVRNSYFRHGRMGITNTYGTNGNQTDLSSYSSTIHIEYNYFDDWSTWGGIFQYTSAQGLVNSGYLVENNTFKNMTAVGVSFGNNGFVGPYTVGANYYGDPSGPLSDMNPSGLGVQIYYGSETIITPWLTSEVLPNDNDDNPPPVKDPDPLPTCCSSVLFFPGVEGSRLYMKKDFGIEDQLWEANIADDVKDLDFNLDGNSINDIYTRDIIKGTNVIGSKIAVKNIYKSFSDDLDTLVNNGKIHAWKPIPYDWRMSVDDIINGGVVLESDTLNIITQVEQMAHDSNTGKVTLIGHSNGGLLIKYLVKRLEDKGEVNLVDNVVLVGSPELGTPEGFSAIAHGLKFKSFASIIAPQKYNKQLALNMPGAYTLLPSKMFFENNTNPIISFDDSVGDFAGLVNGYGNSINSYQEFKDFFLSNNDTRSVPGFDNIDMPAIGNPVLYNKAESVHDIIDNYTLPRNIKVYEISGTGISTVSGIIYKKNPHCFLGICTDSQYLVPELKQTVDGDGTVVNISSSVINGTKYFVDMNTYNKDYGTKYDHADMLENNSIKSLVENIVTDKNTDVPYVVTKDTMPVIKTKQISMHSPVQIDVYDIEGRHTGPCIEPDHPDMNCVDEEIPNSSYVVLGEDKYITIPNDSGYTLKLDGYDAGNFNLDIENYDNDTKVDGVKYKDIPTTVDTTSTIDLTNLPQEILLDNNNDNEPDIKVDNKNIITDLHSRLKTEESNVENNKTVFYTGRPVLVLENVNIAKDHKKEHNKVAIQLKKKSGIIKKQVQVAKKEKNNTVAVVKTQPFTVKIKPTPSVIPMTASVGNATDFGLWIYLKGLFN